jgi:outer membrane protein OmpA-like peptidoglycan-associated protein
MGQNLVPNGSFENFTHCPEEYEMDPQITTVNNWNSPTKGTPDYFNSGSYKCGVPYNWVGNAPAFDGNAYMGIIACMRQIDKNQIAYREYLRVELSDTLQKGINYYASMQIRLGQSCVVSCNGLGMFFSEIPLSSHSSHNYPVKADVVFNDNTIISNKEGWTKVCGLFMARGGEKYLLIGNFLSNQELKYKEWDENLISTPNISPMAYYFIDDVKVKVFSDTTNYYCEGLEKDLPVVFEGKINSKKRMVLEKLYFETDKAIILKESYRELDQLAYELRKNTTIKLAIYGYTDNVGTKEYNQKLSENRALAVRNYLLEKGVSKFRMSYIGFGDLKPIANNDSDEERQLNRRVEIEVVQ